MKNDLDTLIESVVSGAILDGQNQIHDLRSGRATPDEVNQRMQKVYDFYVQKLRQGIIIFK